MRRQWNTERTVELEGSDRSAQLGQALAVKTDPDTLEAIHDAKAILDRQGGQVYIAAYRVKVDAAKYRALVNSGTLTTDAAREAELEDYREPGIYVTLGYLFHYDHLAKLTKAPAEPDASTENGLELEAAEMNGDVVEVADAEPITEDTSGD